MHAGFNRAQNLFLWTLVGATRLRTSTVSDLTSDSNSGCAGVLIVAVVLCFTVVSDGFQPIPSITQLHRASSISRTVHTSFHWKHAAGRRSVDLRMSEEADAKVSLPEIPVDRCPDFMFAMADACHAAHGADLARCGGQ